MIRSRLSSYHYGFLVLETDLHQTVMNFRFTNKHSSHILVHQTYARSWYESAPFVTKSESFGIFLVAVYLGG